jgi:succinyl-CoA synthetase beta subunit
MDIIKLRGGAPANFLDVGGNASEDQVCSGFGASIAVKRIVACGFETFKRPAQSA